MIFDLSVLFEVLLVAVSGPWSRADGAFVARLALADFLHVQRRAKPIRNGSIQP